MSTSPDDRIYSEQHIWLLMLDDSSARIGITDYAQSELGDIVFVELPEEGAEFEASQACAVLESVKTASEIYAPVACKVVEINEDLDDSPEIVNASPYDNGWLCTIQIVDKSAIDSLLNASQYDSQVAV